MSIMTLAMNTVQHLKATYTG